MKIHQRLRTTEPRALVKGMEVMNEIGRIPASAKRRAETARDLGPEIRFRTRRADVQAAVDQTVDERTDDLRPVHDFAAASADVDGELIELNDLPIEENDRNLGPRFLMNRGTSAARLRQAIALFDDPPLHGPSGARREL